MPLRWSSWRMTIALALLVVALSACAMGALAQPRMRVAYATEPGTTAHLALEPLQADADDDAEASHMSPVHGANTHLVYLMDDDAAAPMPSPYATSAVAPGTIGDDSTDMETQQWGRWGRGGWGRGWGGGWGGGWGRGWGGGWGGGWGFPYGGWGGGWGGYPYGGWGGGFYGRGRGRFGRF